MEVITIEKHVFESMIAKLRQLAEKVNEVYPPKKELNKEWMDAAEVCQLLNISKRTLQYYRHSGKISHTMIGYKNFFKTTEVHKLLNEKK